MTGFCPCCGYDLESDQPIVRDGFDMLPYGNLRWHGHEIVLTASERAILWALLKAKGRPVTSAVLSERVGYEGDNNCVQVFISRLRAKMNPVAPCPIKTVWGEGYSIPCEQEAVSA